MKVIQHDYNMYTTHHKPNMCPHGSASPFNHLSMFSDPIHSLPMYAHSHYTHTHTDNQILLFIPVNLVCLNYITIFFILNNTDTLLNLDSLLIQLQAEVTPKWYQFGEAIGMNKETLNKYTNYSDDQCIIEVLDYWLTNHSGQPTWREVAKILRGIGLQRLAYDIEGIYETGIASLLL